MSGRRTRPLALVVALFAILGALGALSGGPAETAGRATQSEAAGVNRPTGPDLAVVAPADAKRVTAQPRLARPLSQHDAVVAVAGSLGVGPFTGRQAADAPDLPPPTPRQLTGALRRGPPPQLTA